MDGWKGCWLGGWSLSITLKERMEELQARAEAFTVSLDASEASAIELPSVVSKAPAAQAFLETLF